MNKSGFYALELGIFKISIMLKSIYTFSLGLVVRKLINLIQE